jgi:hypothetical protein
MLLVIVTCGLITEDVGSRIESLLDRRLAKIPGFERHREDWFDYLRLAFKVEPVGHRYLRTLVLRLKFELGMAVASLPCAVGAFWLNCSVPWRTGIFALAVGAGLYFFAEAKSSNRALSELRREILEKDWSNSPGAELESDK